MSRRVLRAGAAAARRVWAALAWLWAAVWLRGRLAGVRARRLFGGGGGRGERAIGAAASFHLAAADVPVEGVDYDIGELSPELLARLERTGAELLDRARAEATTGARRRRGRRRRTFSLTVAALVSLTVLGAAATALMTGSTGVPAVDRLLGIHDSGRDDSGGRPGVDLTPSAAGPIVRVDVPGRGGREFVEATTYLRSEGGQLCLAIADRDPAIERRPRGLVSCKPPDLLIEDFAIGSLSVIAIRVGAGPVLAGVVTNDVRAVRGRGPGGPVTVGISEPWRPAGTELGSVRSFVAAGTPVPGRPDAEEAHRAMDLSRYRFQITLDDGRVVVARPR